MKKSQNLISGLPASIEQLTVQKSNPLLGLWRSSWTLSEFKILDIYLSRIDSHHPERRCVRIEKGELEEILGVARIRLKDLQERLDSLIIPVHVDDPSVPKGFKTIALFDAIKYVPDSSGLWTIDLQCSKDAMKYIFNIDNLGYLRYKLHSVINLKSRHSYLLFLYIEQNRFRKEWTVVLEDLRHILNCDAPYYREYKRFNDRVLKPSQDEILRITKCRFSYAPIKRGRTTNKLMFSVDNDISFTVLPSNMSFSENEASSIESKNEKHGREFLKTALTYSNASGSEFTDAQLNEIFAYLMYVPLSQMPESSSIYGPEMQRFHYLSCKFAELNRRDEQKKIENRFAYLLAMIKKDAKEN